MPQDSRPRDRQSSRWDFRSFSGSNSVQGRLEVWRFGKVCQSRWTGTAEVSLIERRIERSSGVHFIIMSIAEHLIKDEEQTARALAQRAANEEARGKGLPLPYPNIWDELDLTKVPPDATPEQIHDRYKEFIKLCHPRPRKRHVL